MTPRNKKADKVTRYLANILNEDEETFWRNDRPPISGVVETEMSESDDDEGEESTLWGLVHERRIYDE